MNDTDGRIHRRSNTGYITAVEGTPLRARQLEHQQPTVTTPSRPPSNEAARLRDARIRQEVEDLCDRACWTEADRRLLNEARFRDALVTNPRPPLVRVR
jgi:hypothetical protein